MCWVHFSGSLHLGNVSEQIEICQEVNSWIKHIDDSRISFFKFMNETIRQFQSALPEQTTWSHRSHSRIKRGAFNFVGSIFGELFGMATDKDVTTIKSHINKLVY